ncbi:hypothetical protein CLAFUW4_13550 [Fulvia fulva]|uniref:Uncharacterized protein n=1 Tax=Passalora fulva TaxID=5499 RepID=A0A9Q8PKI2_PASFU|nr:uncharacterized protein CLAFUR5_13401 [Fulvia fulva]KAK4610710.1 hypothetical protein CLAFUR4_13552 [Fulvia fulva]KAK4611476.1 hypothetical protein CLAFUR0_13561 [Fulvia fulva]UJO24180.1 hypothetical protein CLAFUR5_13401 [Fulvia fulva]WPV22348.1 hypothetical protein CLAFUW4_13550 [Fulvia fulva]WPV37248.1 hypothetical protein CLAFUW7_13557 [Fulvia fulva]
MANETTTNMPASNDSEKTAHGNLSILPPELRLEIFNLVLDDFFVTNKAATTNYTQGGAELRPALLNTSKTIRGEAQQSYIRRADSSVTNARDNAVEHKARFHAAHGVFARPNESYEPEQEARKAYEEFVNVQAWRKDEVREMMKSGCVDFQEYVVAMQKKWELP